MDILLYTGLAMLGGMLIIVSIVLYAIFKQ